MPARPWNTTPAISMLASAVKRQCEPLFAAEWRVPADLPPNSRDIHGKGSDQPINGVAIHERRSPARPGQDVRAAPDHTQDEHGRRDEASACSRSRPEHPQELGGREILSIADVERLPTCAWVSQTFLNCVGQNSHKHKTSS